MNTEKQGHTLRLPLARECGHLDAGLDLVVGQCSCGYTTGPTTEHHARKRHAEHVAAARR